MRANTQRQRRALLTAMVAGAALASVPPPTAGARAQGTAPPAQAQKKLEDERLDLEKMRKRAKRLESDVAALAEERGRLNTQLMETADRIKKTEAELTSIESRLGSLEGQERVLRGSLHERHDQIAKLLAALQRMGRNPPPVLFTQREDALKMVRSAMLLAATFPELGDQARALATRLNELVRVMTEIRAQGEQLRAEMTRLNESRTKLNGLLQAKQASLEQRKSELQSMRDAAAAIASSTKDPNVLIARLDEALRDNTGLGAYEAELRRQAEAEAKAGQAKGEQPDAAGAAGAVPAGKAGEEGETDVAVLPVPPKAPNIVEPAPGAALGKPGRIEPEVPFANTKGRLPLPAHGRRVLGFGEKTQFGGESKGMVLETRQGAQVTSPCDGWIVYAGEFRSYGQLLIINAGDGYHVLLAGLSQIDVQPGQFVLAAEPVGTMSGWPQQAQPAAVSSAPVLYVEFRKGGTPIDPDPWWVADHKKVQG